MIWRGVFGFVIYTLVVLVAGLGLELFGALAVYLGKGWPTWFIPIVATVFATPAGVGIGKLALDRAVKIYPAKSIAGVYIAIFLLAALSNFFIVPTHLWDQWFWTQNIRWSLASAFTFYVLWLGHDLT